MSQEPPSLSLLAGPQLLGILLAWGLQGILTVQVYLYYIWFPKDKVAVRLLVYGLLVFEWVQTGLTTAFLFDNFVYGYGQPGALIQFHNTWFSVVIMTSFVSWAVQGFFAWRIWILGHSKVITAGILLLSFAQMSIGIAAGVRLRGAPSAADASAVIPVVSSWLGGAALVDIMISASMTFLLLKNKNGFKRSDNIVNSLVRLTIETGTVTAAVAITELVCFAAFSDTLLYQGPAPVLAKLYSNTLLASLNNRAIMKMSIDGAVVDLNSNAYPMASGLRSRSINTSNSERDVQTKARTALRVEVSEEMVVERDATHQSEPLKIQPLADTV